MNSGRFNFVLICFILVISSVILRLFYWQVIASDELASLGEMQHFSSINIPAKRGEIRTSDNYPLTLNQETYLIYAYLPQLEKDTNEIAELLTPILHPYFQMINASDSAKQKKSNIGGTTQLLKEKLSRKDVTWVSLVKNAQLETKKMIEDLNLSGLGIEPSYSREYPEASMAASLLGFVGSDVAGEEKGYFGLEGYYNLELKGKSGELKQEKDATGKPIIIGEFEEQSPQDGRNLVLHINRSLQMMIENKLWEGIKKYGAKSGEIIIIEPKTGAVIAMTALPSYDPRFFNNYDSKLFKNPVISAAYEPGSTFKVLTMAAALDTKAVEPDTICEICDKPIQIGAYTIKTWNDEYYPQATMEEVIQHSDNVGMVFAAQKLGEEKLVEYLQKFGIGELTGIDLEEEASPNLRDLKDWKEIDLATAAFGQGIAVTGMQMVRAVAAIANDGYLPVPQVVDKIVSEDTREIKFEKGRKIISSQTAEQMKQMMVNAVEKGEAKWAKPEGYKVAGKTGTAQIPVAGHYDQEKTIASFIGFAPAEAPKFVMLVKLREPESSPWGSETAAPLWFSIAKDLLLYYDIQPEQ